MGEVLKLVTILVSDNRGYDILKESRTSVEAWVKGQKLYINIHVDSLITCFISTENTESFFVLDHLREI